MQTRAAPVLPVLVSVNSYALSSRIFSGFCFLGWLLHPIGFYILCAYSSAGFLSSEGMDLAHISHLCLGTSRSLTLCFHLLQKDISLMIV